MLSPQSDYPAGFVKIFTISTHIAAGQTIWPDKSDTPQQSLLLLDWWQEALVQHPSGQPCHPILTALQQTIQRHNLELEPFVDLLHAFRQDQQVVSCDSVNDEQLQEYCQHSANPVGRILLQLCGPSPPPRCD